MAPMKRRRLGQVEAQDVPAVGVDADERGRLADAAGRAQPELLDDGVVDQVAHDGRHRRPGQPGELGQVGPRHRAVAVQGAEQQAAVGPSGVFRGRHGFVCLVDKQTPVKRSGSDSRLFSEAVVLTVTEQFGKTAKLGACTGPRRSTSPSCPSCTTSSRPAARPTSSASRRTGSSGPSCRCCSTATGDRSGRSSATSPGPTTTGATSSPGVESMAIFAGPDAYVSPSWYATKQETGKVVPTWNYVAVHAYGELVVHDDPVWLEDLVRRLTDHHEASRDEPWSVDDAPADFVAGPAAGHRRHRAADHPARGQGQAEPEPPRRRRGRRRRRPVRRLPHRPGRRRADGPGWNDEGSMAAHAHRDPGRTLDP